MPNAKVLSEKQAIVASLTEKLQGAAAGVLSNIVLFVPTLVVSLATIGSPEAYLAGILFVYLLFLVFILVFNALVTMPLTVGGIRYTMENRCGYPPLDSVLSPFRNKEQYLNVAKATLMYLLEIFGFTLLFIVPGIVRGYQLRYVPYLLAENPYMSTTRAMQLSREMMHGEKWHAFLLGLSFVGWVILGMLTLGIGLLFLEPYYQATMAELYAALRSKAFAMNLTDASELGGFVRH